MPILFFLGGSQKNQSLLWDLCNQQSNLQACKKIDINVVSFHAGLAMPYVSDYIHKVYAQVAHTQLYLTHILSRLIYVRLSRRILLDAVH